LFIFKKLSGRIRCPSADRYRNVYLVFTIYLFADQVR